MNAEESRSSGDQNSRTSDSTGSGPPTDPIVSVDGLEKVYDSGDDTVEAVTDVSFEIQPGTVVGILGPNGAGKTTMIKSILSLTFPSAGNVRVGGVDVHKDTSTAHERMSAMLEGARNTYWRLTVRENLEIFSVIGGNDYRTRTDEIDTLLQQFGLDTKANTVVRDLSRGQKQKVSLACTLARDTEVVFLDEPTLGLDIESTRRLQTEIRRLIENDGRTVIISSHDMDVIQTVCDRVIVMNEGEIVADDTIDHLVDLFSSKTYEIVTAGRLDDDIEERLASEFFLKTVERRSDSTVFEIEIDDEFYRLVSVLEQAGIAIESFTEIELDFDDIFLHLTDQTRNERVSYSEAVSTRE